MKQPRPPRLPTWLLERLGTGEHASSLIGDLAEQYAVGRSRGWYWRQAIIALALDLLPVLRAHSLSFILALIAGCALTAAGQWVNSLVFVPVGSNVWRESSHPWSIQALAVFVALVLSRASLIAFSFVSVWAVTRVHRAHQRGVLVAFVLILAAQQSPWLARLAFDTLGDGRFARYLVYDIYGVVFQVAFALAGGLWAIRTQKFADMDHRTRLAAVLVGCQQLLGAVIFAGSRIAALSPFRVAAVAYETAELATLAYLVFVLWLPQTRHQEVAIE